MPQMAIAHAVLDHLVSTVKCKTLFITHYPLVATALEKKHPADVENLHMGYQEECHIDGTRDIIFLYRLTRGLAVESFGVECARLAGIPESVLQIATQRSGTMQTEVQNRVRRNM
jgi:DNA mismatch repair protein MSH3